MQRITYASGSILTGDRIADAIGRYAQALALNEKSDMVSFPVVLDSGETAVAKILIGPASQILMIPEPSRYDDVDDDAVVAEIERLTGSLHMSRPEAEERADVDDAYPTDF